MKTPVQLAYAWYQAQGDALTFTEYVGGFMRAGYVYCGPDAFILAKEVLLRDGQWLYEGAGSVNCWFIQLAAGLGALPRIRAMAPRKHPFVAFYRVGKDTRLRVWAWSKLERLCHGRRLC